LYRPRGQCVTVKLADPDNDGTVDREEFEAACAKGLVTYTDHAPTFTGTLQCGYSA